MLKAVRVRAGVFVLKAPGGARDFSPRNTQTAPALDMNFSWTCAQSAVVWAARPKPIVSDTNWIPPTPLNSYFVRATIAFATHATQGEGETQAHYTELIYLSLCLSKLIWVLIVSFKLLVAWKMFSQICWTHSQSRSGMRWPLKHLRLWAGVSVNLQSYRTWIFHRFRAFRAAK